jgi:hypothetical protein
MSLPDYTRYVVRDARLAKENHGKSIRRVFKTEAAARTHIAANSLTDDMLHFDVDYPEGARIRTKRLHSVADAAAFAKAHPMPEPAAKAAEAPHAQGPVADAAPPTTPEPEDKPALTVVKGGKPGGNGFSEPAKKSRRPVMAAGTQRKD